MTDTMKHIPKVMVDACVLSTGDADPLRGKLVEDNGCAIRTANKLLVFERRKVQQTQEDFLPFILAIGEAARRHEIACCSYRELEKENVDGRHSLMCNLSGFYAFHGIPFAMVPSPIEREKWFDVSEGPGGVEIGLFEYYRPDKSRDKTRPNVREKFMDFLLAADPKKLYQTSLRHPRCTDFERNNIKNLHVFQNLCDAIHRKRARDAFHFWAAECNNIDYFLTTDGKFLRPYYTAIKDKKIKFRCKAVSPEELVRELNISTDGIQLPEHGKMFLMNGIEFHS